MAALVSGRQARSARAGRAGRAGRGSGGAELMIQTVGGFARSYARTHVRTYVCTLVRTYVRPLPRAPQSSTSSVTLVTIHWIIDAIFHR